MLKTAASCLRNGKTIQPLPLGSSPYRIKAQLTAPRLDNGIQMMMMAKFKSSCIRSCSSEMSGGKVFAKQMFVLRNQERESERASKNTFLSTVKGRRLLSFAVYLFLSFSPNFSPFIKHPSSASRRDEGKADEPTKTGDAKLAALQARLNWTNKYFISCSQPSDVRVTSVCAQCKAQRLVKSLCFKPTGQINIRRSSLSTFRLGCARFFSSFAFCIKYNTLSQKTPSSAFRDEEK